MWEITKQFHAEYGHRVWNQKLNSALSLDSHCACRHLHGHSLLLEVSLKGNDLHDGMVTDFKHLNCLKRFVDEVIDHKFILDENDPMFPMMITRHDPRHSPIFAYPAGGSNLYRVIVTQGLDPLLKEYYDGFVFVDFVPTSENLAQWIHTIASNMLKSVGRVSEVKWHETAKSCATYKHPKHLL